MTREEIAVRSRSLVLDMDRCFILHSGYYEEAERHMTALVRATLEKAARAVCNVCRVGTVPPVKDGEGWYHDTPEGSIWCGSGEIHDLIAALTRRPTMREPKCSLCEYDQDTFRASIRRLPGEPEHEYLKRTELKMCDCGRCERCAKNAGHDKEAKGE